VALLEGERALSLLACEAGSAAVVCLGAAKTARAKTNIKTISFIARLHALIPKVKLLNHTHCGKCRTPELQPKKM
jgi:hypothetical protein